MFSRFWNRLPAIVRGILVAELVVTIGAIPPSIAVLLNLRTSPSMPWVLVVTAAWLWFFWWYLSGHGWPRSAQEARRRDLRAPSLPKPAWAWALIAGTLGITGTNRQFVVWVAVMVICFAAFVPALRALGARSDTTR